MKKMILLFSSVFLMLTGYSQAGKPDLIFGNGGYINPPGGALVAVQADGKIITAGAAIAQGSSDPGFQVNRFNTDGTPDKSFNGNGTVISDFGLGRQIPNSVLIQPDGKIVVSGTSFRNNPADYRIVAARYNANGSLDQSFHGTGFNSTGSISSNGYLAFESNGNILVAGDFSITRFKTNGDADSSFGMFGTLRTKEQLTANYSIAVQPDGKILIGGLQLRTNGTNSDFGLARYNQNGTVDNSFGTNGVATTPLLDNATIFSLFITADGKIMVAGTARYAILNTGALALARYNSNGTLDNGFAGGGTLVTSFTSFPADLARVAIAPLPEGKFLVAVNSSIARFQANGLLDVSFNTFGVAPLDLSAGDLVVKDNRAYVGSLKNSTSALGVIRLDAAPQTGLFYKYFEGTWTTLPDFNSLTPVKTGNTENINLEVRTPGRNDNFAFIWRGYINIKTFGSYTFETVSDDGSKLYFNASYSAGGIALVNNDGVHAATAATGTVNIPSTGMFPITFTYFEKDGGESMQVYWTGPGIPRQLIPNSAFGGATTPPPTTEGLNYKYYEGTWNTLPDFTMLTPVKTGNTSNIDLGVRTPGRNDNFAFVWEGTINIPAPGAYTFTTTSDDGSKLYFNSQYVPSAIATVNNDGLHAPTAVSATVNVPAAGPYPIAITFFEKDGGEAMGVSWSGPGFTTQPIPDKAFSKTSTGRISGLTYKLYQGSFDNVPDFSTLTPIKTANTPNVDINVRPADINDNFAFTWEGFITIPVSGTHGFETVSDDGSTVVVNGMTVVNNQGTHGPQGIDGNITLAAGTYPITISYFDKTGGQVMELYWKLSGSNSYQYVPNSAFTTTQVETPVQTSGLSYKLYHGVFNALPDFNGLTPTKTGITATPDISVRAYWDYDYFAFLWEGNITLPTPGDYTFELVSDDGSKFYFNTPYSPSATPLINNDGIHAPTSAIATVNASGTLPIAITYFEKEGGETFQLYWTGPGITRQLVPASAFTLPAPVVALTKDAVGLQSNAADIAGDKANVSRVYPNPFAERFMVNFYNEKTTDEISIAVYDINGKQLYNQYAGRLSQGKTSMMIDLKNKQLKDGVYFLTISKNGVRAQTMKLVKQK